MNVTPGYHSYTAKKEGYRDETGSANVPCGQSATINFVLEQCLGTISGYVRAPNGTTPIPGLTMTASGGGNLGSDLTDAPGYYEITNLSVAGTPGTVTPSKGSDQFSPSNSPCDLNCDDLTCTQNFTDISTKTITGTITYAACNGAVAAEI